MEAWATQACMQTHSTKKKGLVKQESLWDTPQCSLELTPEFLVTQFLHVITSIRVNSPSYKQNDDFPQVLFVFWDFSSFATAKWNKPISAYYALLWGKKAGLIQSASHCWNHSLGFLPLGPALSVIWFSRSLSYVLPPRRTAALWHGRLGFCWSKILAVLNKSWDNGLY